MANDSAYGLAARGKALLDSGKWSDLTIFCGTEQFRVHRALVCSSSPFFDAACSGKFLESQTGEIRLEDDDPDSVKRMIGWIYTQNYDDIQIDPNESESCESSDDLTSQPASKTELSPRKMQRTSQKILNNVRVYALADKYDIPGLKDLAKSRIWDPSNRHLIENDFQAVAVEIYSSTGPEDRGLRDLVLEICTSRIEVDLSDREWESNLRGNGDLAFDLLKATVARKDLALSTYYNKDFIDEKNYKMRFNLVDTREEIRELRSVRYCRNFRCQDKVVDIDRIIKAVGEMIDRL